MKYTFSPLSGFWSAFMQTCEVIGYSRAASHLASRGMHEQAKACMMEIKKIKSAK